jgi:hypothetical protein
VKLPLLTAITILLAGCRFTDKTGTAHQVVIGFGILSTKSAPSNAIPTVSKTQIVGVGVSRSGFNAGYTSSTVIRVPTNQNILIEVSDAPGRPLKVTTP